MQLTIRILREMNGRSIGDIVELPGVVVYCTPPEDAVVEAKVLALRAIAEEVERGEVSAETDGLRFSVAA